MSKDITNTIAGTYQNAVSVTPPSDCGVATATNKVVLETPSDKNYNISFTFQVIFKTEQEREDAMLSYTPYFDYEFDYSDSDGTHSIQIDNTFSRQYEDLLEYPYSYGFECQILPFTATSEEEVKKLIKEKNLRVAFHSQFLENNDNLKTVAGDKAFFSTITGSEGYSLSTIETWDWESEVSSNRMIYTSGDYIYVDIAVIYNPATSTSSGIHLYKERIGSHYYPWENYPKFYFSKDYKCIVIVDIPSDVLEGHTSFTVYYTYKYQALYEDEPDTVQGQPFSQSGSFSADIVSGTTSYSSSDYIYAYDVECTSEDADGNISISGYVVFEDGTKYNL